MERFSEKNRIFLHSLETVPYVIINDKEINGELFSFVTYNSTKYFSEWFGFYKEGANNIEKQKYKHIQDCNENYVSLLREMSRFRKHRELCGRFFCYTTILKIQNKKGDIIGLVILYDVNSFFETISKNIGTYFQENWDVFRWILSSYTIFSNLAILHKNSIYYLNIHPSSILYNDDETISRFMKFSPFKNYRKGEWYSYTGLKEDENSVFIKQIVKNYPLSQEKTIEDELKLVDILSGLLTILTLYINDGKQENDDFFNFYSNKDDVDFLFERIQKRCFQKEKDASSSTQLFVQFLLENLFYLLKGDRNKLVDYFESPEYLVLQTEQIFRGCIPKAMVESHRRCYSISTEN